MSEPMTKLLALEITVELWRWLEKNPSCEKVDWPRWYGIGRCANHCACCQYVRENSTFDGFPCASLNKLIGEEEGLHESMLNLCPLKSLWPEGCEESGSPYLEWSDRAGVRDRSELAKQIADAAEKEISLLLKKQKQQQ